MSEAWLPWLSVSLVGVLIARWSWLASRVPFSSLLDLTGAALIVLAWHPNFWSRLSQGYPRDSFFTLSLTGRIGLIAFTVLLVILLVYLSTYKSRWLQKTGSAWYGGRATMPALDILLTILLFVVGLTIVPQLHFGYYHLLFDNLPRQLVIKPLPLKTVWHILLVPREANLAIHSAGLCGWWMIIVAALSWLRSLRLANHMVWLVGFAALANMAWHRFA